MCLVWPRQGECDDCNIVAGSQLSWCPSATPPADERQHQLDRAVLTLRPAPHLLSIFPFRTASREGQQCLFAATEIEWSAWFWLVFVDAFVSIFVCLRHFSIDTTPGFYRHIWCCKLGRFQLYVEFSLFPCLSNLYYPFTWCFQSLSSLYYHLTWGNI